MSFIVIEVFSEPIVCTDEDGYVIYFDTFEEAAGYAADCQDGRILEL